MKAEPAVSVPTQAPRPDHEPRGKAKAHGLVRRLQEDTFNGASADKHRARFADRLAESAPVADASEPAADDPLADVSVADANIADAPTADASGSAIPAEDGSSIDTATTVDVTSSLLNEPVETFSYRQASDFYLSGGSAQFDWSA